MGLRMLASAIIYKKAPVGAIVLDGKIRWEILNHLNIRRASPSNFGGWFGGREKKMTDVPDPIEFSFLRNGMPTISTPF